MSVASSISIDEYLNTSYEPDCDYVDGVLEERNVGKRQHSRLQTALGSYLYTREKLWGIQAYTEQRVRDSPSRVRIPDVCVMLKSQPYEDVLAVPPFICIEILSPDDQMSRVTERIDDYLFFGVPYVWVIDPRRRRSYAYTAAGMTEAHDAILRTADPEIVLPLLELWESLL